MLPPAGAQALQNLDACAHTFNASFHAHTHKFNDMQKSCFQTIQTEWNCTREHSWHVLPSMVCAARLKLNSTPPKWKINKKIIRASGETSKNCLHPNTTHRLCASVKKLLPFASDRVYLYHSTEHFRPQCPHRKKLNPSITDDIIKLLNEITVPVEEGLFSRMGLYNKIILWANAHAGGRLLYPNRPTHPGIKAHCGVWSHCRVPSHFLLKNPIFFFLTL